MQIIKNFIYSLPLAINNGLVMRHASNKYSSQLAHVTKGLSCFYSIPRGSGKQNSRFYSLISMPVLENNTKYIYNINPQYFERELKDLLLPCLKDGHTYRLQFYMLNDEGNWIKRRTDFFSKWLAPDLDLFITDVSSTLRLNVIDSIDSESIKITFDKLDTSDVKLNHFDFINGLVKYCNKGYDKKYHKNKSKFKFVRYFSSTSPLQSDDNELDNININKEKILEIINSIKDTYSFRIAFTHKSARLFDPKNESHESYERLEFFGDSLLEYYTTCFLFKCFPKFNEGDLTQLRSLLVERKNLAKISKNIGLDEYLNLAVKVEKSTKILADIFESFVGALYIEKGERTLHEFLSLTLFNRSETTKQLKDYKINSLFATNALANANLDINLNENVISSNAQKELTFKFNLDNKESKDNMIKEIDLLSKIFNILESGFQGSNKQILEFKKEVINHIDDFIRNFNINKLDIYDINMELKNTNKLLYELNNNTLKINKELTDAQATRLNIFRNINNIILILILILAIIVIKLIFYFII